MSKNLNIIIYNSEAHRSQSNIGQQFEEVNPGGTIQFTNNRIVIPFNGSHNQLLDDLKHELYRHSIYKMLYGTKVDEVLRQLGKSTYPSWFVESIIAYYSKGFTSADDNLLKQYLLSHNAKSFNDCIAWNPMVTGTAFLQYIEKTYGKFTLNALLFQLTSKRDLNKAIQVVYKKPLAYLMQSTLAYFAHRHMADNLHQDSILQVIPVITSHKKKSRLIDGKLYFNDDGANFVYLTRTENKLQLFWRQSIPQEKKPSNKLLISIERKPTSDILPIVILGRQKNPHLSVMYIENGRLLLLDWQLSNKGILSHKTIRYVHDLDGVVSACYGPKNTSIFLAAYKDGQTDLFEYTISSGKLEQLTNDPYDENNLCIYNHNSVHGLLFTSNNSTDTIPNLNRKFSQKSVKENVHFITANQLETLKLGKSFREGSDKTILLTLSNRQNVHTLSTDEMGKIYFLTDENGIQNCTEAPLTKQDSTPFEP
jgi:hypothetical protein